MTQTPPPAHATSNSVATAIMQRRLERQRFDSADFAMAQQKQKTHPPARMRLASCGEPNAAPAAPTQLDSGDDFSDWVQCELEPEPESMSLSSSSSPATSTHDMIVVPPQQVHRIRLQRFDSADWAIKNHQTKNFSTEDTTDTTMANTVAKLRLERHAYAICSFVSTPTDVPAQYFVKNA